MNGAEVVEKWMRWWHSTGWTFAEQPYGVNSELAARFDDALAAEREACASMVEGSPCDGWREQQLLDGIAAAIRARK